MTDIQPDPPFESRRTGPQLRDAIRRVLRDSPYMSEVEPLLKELDLFVADLSDLCRKHGIGITGDATLFVMEPVDHQLTYQVDAGSRLSFR